MRWSIIRLIWFRELRDQLRDRRTLFMVAVLPVLIYPILGVGVLQFALGFLKKESVVGVCGSASLPQPAATSAGVSPLPAVAWFSAAPPAPGAPGGPATFVGAAALAHFSDLGLGQDYPPLLAGQGDETHFLPTYFDTPEEANSLTVKRLPWPGGAAPAGDPASAAWLQEVARTPLPEGVDLLLVVPPDFRDRLEHGDRPLLSVLTRTGDERARRLDNQVRGVLEEWRIRLKEVRLLRAHLPADFDVPFALRDPERDRAPLKQMTQGLFDALARFCPFLLVLWALTGALYPAVDLCAGEKERGTMETLLISPASREEIVYGKFLTIWVFSAATTLLNLLSMGLTTALFAGQLSVAMLRPEGLAWCVLLCVPLSAFFSALCLAVGAYARSSKEGQYYLMPLFLVTMPLIFLTLAPGVELNAFYSMVPVTGVALLLQHLMLASGPEQVRWGYFPAVLAPIILYGWLALRWAVSQFQREEVLFREAERLDIGLWLRHLLRAKEALPTAAQALSCFALIMGLRWLALGCDNRLSPPFQAAIILVAFVITPPLFMALLLTTRPLHSLALRVPPGRALLTAFLLVLLLVLPLAELTSFIARHAPDLTKQLLDNDPLSKLTAAMEGGNRPASWWQFALVLVVLAPVCEEVAFRGFILVGLRQRFHPWTAILLSSFLFAFFHLNVFQVVPTFILGILLGLMATRSRSILPGMLLHLIYNGLLLAPVLSPALTEALSADLSAVPLLRPALVTVCALLAVVYLAVNGYRLWADGRTPWWDVLPPVASLAPASEIIGVNGSPRTPAELRVESVPPERVGS